jgi:hypothetical protein
MTYLEQPFSINYTLSINKILFKLYNYVKSVTALIIQEVMGGIWQNIN